MNKKINPVIAILIIIAFSCLMAFIIWDKYVSSPWDLVSENLIINNNVENNKAKLKIEIIKEGTGDTAVNGNKVSVHYTGKFTNGTKFDSSVDRGEPLSFTLGAGQMIRGWDEGILGMKVGEKRKLTIPPDLAYGVNGYGPIPPNSTLIFEIELLGIASK